MASALPVMALGSPRPPRTLHRVAPYLFGYDNLPLVCVRRARCSSLSARSSASSSCYRAEGSLPLPHLTFALRSPTVRDVEVVSRRLVRVSKDRPFTVLGAEEPTPTSTRPCPLRRPVANRSHVPPSWFSATLTVCSSSTLSGCCTGVPVLGFATFPAVRHCCPRHGILPFEALLPAHSGLTRGWRTILAPGLRHLKVSLQFTVGLASSSLVARTSRLCSAYRALSHGVLPPSRDRCSLGLVRIPVACTGVHRPPRSREGVGLASSRWVSTSGPDERQRSPRGPARLAWMGR